MSTLKRLNCSCKWHNSTTLAKWKYFLALVWGKWIEAGSRLFLVHVPSEYDTGTATGYCCSVGACLEYLSDGVTLLRDLVSAHVMAGETNFHPVTYLPWCTPTP